MGLFLAYLPQFLIVAVLTLIEHGRNPARSDWWINLQAWAVNFVVMLTILPLFHYGKLPSLIDGASLPFWIALPLVLLVGDLGEYLFHRAQHSVPLLWAMHSLHHSDPNMSALTTSRHFWGDMLVKSVTVWTAVGMVVVPTPEILGIGALISLYHYVVHSRLRIDLGRWSWLINTPAYHRRHHSTVPEHYDSNFASLFPIYDVIAGSYRRPDGFPPTGLDRAPKGLSDIVFWPLSFLLQGRPAVVSEAA